MKIQMQMFIMPITLLLICAGCEEGTKKSNTNDNCQAPTGPPITLRMGALEPRSGSSANDMWIEAIHMALEEMNAALACNPNSKNIQFELIESDDGNDASIVPGLVDQMLAQNILALFSDTSGVSGAANAMNYDGVNPRGLPIVCSPCTHPSFNTTTGSVKSQPNPGPGFPDEQWENGMRDPDNWLRRTSITGDPDIGLAGRILYSRGTAGDMNNDGLVKVAFYSAGSSCKDNLLVRNLPDLSRFRCELVKGPGSEIDPNSWTTFGAEAAQLLDQANSSLVETVYPPDLLSSPEFLAADANGIPLTNFFTIDTDAGTIVTSAALPDDGYPDFLFNYLSPAHSLGSIQAINRLSPSTNQPWLTIQSKNSFVRASTLALIGSQA